MKQIGVFLFLGLFLFLSCNNTSREIEKPVYTVTIVPQEFFLRELIGDAASINVMVPPGASPATYDPTPRQLQQLQQSDTYFMVGELGYEQTWKERLKKQFPKTVFVNTTEGIDLLHSRHSHEDHVHVSVDPHVWMSPTYAKIMVGKMYSSLLNVASVDSAVLKENFEELTASMDSVHRVFLNLFSGVDSLSFLIFHPAMTYFAHTYGLEQVEIEYQGKEPSPAYLKRITDYARRENVKLIFIQEEFDKSNATLIASEIEAPLVQINPLANDWFAIMKEIATHFENYITTSR